MGCFRRATAGLAAMGLAIGAALLMAPAATAATTGSSYGAGAQYQVELSTNVPGEGFWIWAELGPNGTGNYEETDCIHLGGGHATDAASHAAGDVTAWSVSGGTLTIEGVNVLGGLETVTLAVEFSPGSSGYGAASFMVATVTSALISSPPIPVGATLSLPVHGEVAP